LVFTAEDETHGWELWGIKDGSNEIELLLESLPGAESNGPRILGELNGWVYFGTQVEGVPPALWKTNGSAEGTVPVSWPDLWLPNVWSIQPGVAFRGSLYFPVEVSQNEMALWKLDGTKEGTFLFDNTKTWNLKNISVVNDLIYFYTEDRELKLWSSDGTPSGTQSILQGGDIFLDVSGPINFQGSLFFPWDDRKTGADLWKIDGAPGDSHPYSKLRSHPNHGGNPRNFLALKDYLLFWASDSFTTWNLYSTNEKGSTRLASFDLKARVSSFARFGDKVGFVVTQSGGSALWATDGTQAGTVRIAQLGDQPGFQPGWILPFQEGLLFAVDDGVHGLEMWKSDGTQDGTFLVKDISPGKEPGILTDFQAVEWNGVVYFQAKDEAHGEEVWRTDGTTAGTKLLKDINPGESGSFAFPIKKAGDFLFFLANSGNDVFRLWRTDGTESGTKPVPGTSELEDYSDPTALGFVGDSVFFFASGFTGFGDNLWMTEGLSGPAKFLTYIDQPITEFIPFQGSYFFVANYKRDFNTI